LDFTKGNHRALSRLGALLDKNPRSRPTLSPADSRPSRSTLPAYHALQQQTYGEVERINAKFKENGWRPIILIDQHQEPARLRLYRAADFAW